MLIQWIWTKKTEGYGQKYQTMEQPKHDNQEKDLKLKQENRILAKNEFSFIYLEKRCENMGLRGCRENESQECTHTSIENCRSNISQSLNSAFIFRSYARISRLAPNLIFITMLHLTWTCHKSMRNMSRVIDTQSHSNDQINARHDINGQSPKVHKPTDIDLSSQTKGQC